MACVLVLAHFLKLLLPLFNTRLQRNLESMRLMWRGSCTTSWTFQEIWRSEFWLAHSRFLEDLSRGSVSKVVRATVS